MKNILKKLVMTKIGWFVLEENPSMELLAHTPEPLDILKNNNAGYKYCPATNHYFSNTFVIKSPYTLHLEFVNSNLAIKETSLNMEVAKNLIRLDSPQIWHSPTRPIFQMDLFQGFVADESVWMEVTMPTMDSRSRKLPGRIIPGEFDIYSWQRGLSYSFEWLDINSPFIIKKDDPLYYVRFRSKNLSEKFKVVKIQETPELNKSRVRCENSKFYYKDKSWTLMKFNRLLRPKKFIK